MFVGGRRQGGCSEGRNIVTSLIYILEIISWYFGEFGSFFAYVYDYVTLRGVRF